LPTARVRGCYGYAALPDQIAEFTPDVVFSIRFAGTKGYPAAALTGPGGPHWIAVGGSGVDHLGAWNPARTHVTNAAGIAADQIAEFVIGAALHVRLDMPGLMRDQAARHWRRERVMRPLRGGICLIIGLGRTGMAVARRAGALGMYVLGIRARPAPAEGVEAVHRVTDLAALLPRADLVVVCTPLTQQTRGLITGAQIAAMKPDAVLVDVSRGGVVDGTALAGALATGHLAGAALDVFETEPLPTDHPLWSAPRCLISPHASAVYHAWEAETVAHFCRNLTRFASGLPLLNLVDPSRGY
jgi:phosphoglycerate dehydrogenase-like enzyme